MNKNILAGLGVAAVLSFGSVPPVHATFSGDNGLIAVAKSTTGRIFTVQPTTGEAASITGAGASQPTWSPDGKKLAYVRGGHIFIVAADGSNARVLSSEKNASDHDPTWSRDGSKLAFVRTKYQQSAVYMTPIDSRQAVILSGWSTTVNYRSPSWSPDGKQIVYEEYDVSSARLLVKDWSRGSVQELTQLSDVTESSQASWSPNGRKILYRDSINELYTIWPDGSHRTVLSDGDSYNGSWSPDGSKVAFIEDPDDDYVSISEADGTVVWVPLKKTDYDSIDTPIWSPDGTILAFMMERSGQHDLYTLDIDSGVQKRLVQNVNSGMSWQSQ